MSYYAVVNQSTGIVENIVDWDGVTEWSPGEGFIAVETEIAQIGWTYANDVLSAPPVPAPSAAEILAVNTSTQATLLATASQAMTPLLLSLQLGNATTDETAQAKAWQTYYRAVQAIDLTAQSPTWPTQPA